MGKRLASIFGALAIAGALVIGLQGPAQAGVWQVTDGFEGNPAAVWSFARAGTGGGGFDINAGTARTPYNDAWLTIQSSGWSSVGRSVHITPVQFHQTTCAARVYVLPLGVATVNFEIIQPSSWRYISLKTVTLSGSSYQAVITNSWNAVDLDVFIRVSLIYSGSFSAVRVDDLLVQCSYV